VGTPRQTITEEAEAAAREAREGSPADFAIRVNGVSRLFLSETDDAVIPAVNNVSLGIRRGVLFGFLGATGAGKTTLLKMITAEIPVSSGTIQVDGLDVGRSTTGRIAICPQFNDHLAAELTIAEHFRIFSMIYDFSPAEAHEITEQIVADLMLEEHRDKPIKELSGGNARKLAVALALISPATIVLLDEPTSSLDPIVRHRVHESIARFHGVKTILLCTHLLGEAETLCDTISIMIKGSIVVIGTPQYLSSKFGTEWRVDLLLMDDSDQTAARVSSFMQESLPNARLAVTRRKNRIYSVPAADIEIAPLFRLLKNAVQREIGIRYFTCSSTTLEKVFLELVTPTEGEYGAARQQ
jgi:ABC-type multidrug transport system ATPase subunit